MRHKTAILTLVFLVSTFAVALAAPEDKPNPSDQAGPKDKFTNSPFEDKSANSISAPTPAPQPVHEPDPAAVPEQSSSPGTEFPAPVVSNPMPSPFASSPAVNAPAGPPAMTPSAFQPSVSPVQASTQNQAPHDPMVSVYSQASSTGWMSGDPFNPDTPAAVSNEQEMAPSPNGRPVAEAQPASSFMFILTGEVTAKTRSSVTIKDFHNNSKTIGADSRTLSGLEKGNRVQVTLIPGSNRAQSLQRIG